MEYLRAETYGHADALDPGMFQSLADGTRLRILWVHYRLAEATDPVLARILQAVTHALGHLESVRRDTRALEKTTGCAVPPQSCQPALDCCAPRTPAGRRS